MSGGNPTLKDIWRLLGTMNKRFDVIERQIVKLREDVTRHGVELDSVKVEMRLGFGALKQSIEARDFRLDDHGRRLTELESRS